MFSQRLRLGFLRLAANDAYARRVFNLYLRRHRDDLLGVGYHHYKNAGRGVLRLSCSYRALFFGSGFYPQKRYVSIASRQLGEPDILRAIASYDPETEVIAHLQIDNADLSCLSRLSKQSLALSVLHRQYLNRLLDYVATPGPMPS